MNTEERNTERDRLWTWTVRPELRELRNYVDNDDTSYRNLKAVRWALAESVTKGEYDPAKALESFLHVINTAAKTYREDRFPSDCCKTLAIELIDEWEEEAQTTETTQ
jgi:hypothetical protein